jgi:hypothetical protein
VITPDNVNEYFWLFMAFVRNGEGEPFAIIESLNGFGLVNKDKPGQRKPEDMRLTYEGANAEGNIFGFRGYMVYQSQLFGISMPVRKNGLVEMLDDDPLGFIVRLH